MFKRISLIVSVLVIAVVLSVSGCTTTSSPKRVIKSHDLVTADLKIFTGKTTKADIVKWLGEPHNVSTDTSGNEKWMYFSSRTGFDETRLDVTFKDDVVFSNNLFGPECENCSREIK
jgi:outer membrane protein assembly factor BamE (lipoprotein component of BamABCDE complex)